MALNQINRLFDKTNQDLVICQQKIDNWTKFIDDYRALNQRLTTITDKTRHNVMVPIGGTDLAFMEGCVEHTNEILVLLGDNYFVERSAKQAKEIVGRRIAKCQQMLDQLNQERTHLQNWLQFSKKMAEEGDNQDFVEIIEDYDEEKEKKWREMHKERVRQHKLSKNESDEVVDENLFRRLDELEIKENTVQTQELKSILKKTIKREESLQSDKSVSFDETKSSDEPHIDPNVDNKTRTDEPIESPFQNQVIERDIDPDSLSRHSVSAIAMKSSPKIVSKFKANRMKK